MDLNSNIHSRFLLQPFNNEIQSTPENSNFLNIPTNDTTPLSFYIYAQDISLNKEVFSNEITYFFEFDC